jgi:DNA-binding LytR/AlgR family response regulator
VVFWQIHRFVVVKVSVIDKVKKDLSGKMQVVIEGQKFPVIRAMQVKFNHY